MCHRTGPARCPYHSNSEASYHAQRQTDVARMEYETRMFPGDVQLWLESHTPMTFKDWLIGQRRGARA